MVNDRVNCNEVYYFLDIQALYNLTYVLKVLDYGLLFKNVLPIEVGRGTC